MSDLLVIAAGGTGGHMFPAQALAEAWLAKGGRVKLTTDVRGARYVGGFPDPVDIEVLASATFARGGVFAKLTAPFQILRGIMGAIATMRQDWPAVVVGFGGYPAIPAMAAAWILRLPRMLHEQNGVLGRVNQLFAKRVNVVACGTWPTELPSGANGIFTGNPVRAAILDRAGARYQPQDTGIKLVVFGGSQGSKIVSDAAAKAVALLSDGIRAKLSVTHQAREEDAPDIKGVYAEAGVPAAVTPFIDDMPDRLTEAHLVICRSGASSVADVTVVGRPAIFVPLAMAIRDEQTANARAMAQAGGAIVIQEGDLTPQRLAEDITRILTTPGKGDEMAAAALICGRPDATDALLDIAQKQAQKDRS